MRLIKKFFLTFCKFHCINENVTCFINTSHCLIHQSYITIVTPSKTRLKVTESISIKNNLQPNDHWKSLKLQIKQPVLFPKYNVVSANFFSGEKFGAQIDKRSALVESRAAAYNSLAGLKIESRSRAERCCGGAHAAAAAALRAVI